MKRPAAGDALQPGDLTLAEGYIRTVIDSDISGLGRSWHDLPLTNLLAHSGGASLLRWPFGTTGVPTWRP